MEVIEVKPMTYEVTSENTEAGVNFLNSDSVSPTQQVILFVLALTFIGFRIGLGILHLIALLYG